MSLKLKEITHTGQTYYNYHAITPFSAGEQQCNRTAEQATEDKDITDRQLSSANYSNTIYNY
jgi:hypothetical protein